MLITTLLISTSLLGAVGAGPDTPKTPASTPRPTIELWTNHDDDLLRSGEGVRVYFRTQDNAYVTVFRVDTDGRLEVLFPEEPWDNNYARARDRYEIRRYGRRDAFVVNEYPGTGFLFAVSSRDPFNYADLIAGSTWDYRFIGAEGRIVGDPYVAFTDLINVVVPLTYDEYEYDVLPYHVEEHFDYPRFVCYDCHAYAQYPVWDPYQDTCVRFSIVVYDDPYYYPARVRPGTHVVFARPVPASVGPKYVVVERNPVEPFVRRVNRQTPVNDPGPRRVLDPEPDRRPTPRRLVPDNEADARRRVLTPERRGATGTETGRRPSPSAQPPRRGTSERLDPRATPQRLEPDRRQPLDVLRRPPTVRPDSTAAPQPTLQRREPTRPNTPTVERRTPTARERPPPPPPRRKSGDSTTRRKSKPDSTSA
jgi:hypothetical protein